MDQAYCDKSTNTNVLYLGDFHRSGSRIPYAPALPRNRPNDDEETPREFAIRMSILVMTAAIVAVAAYCL